MKKAIILCLFFAVIFCSNDAFAKIRRVGYAGLQVPGTDYTDVNSAVVAASNDDTIQLYQNANVGTSNTITKRLVFIGFGYYLYLNPGIQAVTATSYGTNLRFGNGSENSVVQGVFGDFQIGSNDITILRCAGNVYLGYNDQVGYAAISNVTIMSSYINNLYGQNGAVSNALISNCIITGQASCLNIAGLFANNIFYYSSSFGACVVKNNVFTTAGYCPSGTSAIFQNNLLATSSCGITGSGNLFSINMANVFSNWNDGNFGSESNLALKPGSPAIGFGTDGNGNPTDAGIYGGEAGRIYKLSGIPAIPAIYQLSAPQLNASTNPYTITVSVRSNN